MLNHSALTCRLQWHDVAPRGMLYLESFNSFLSPGGGHDPLLYAGGGLQGPLAAQWARGWRGCQGANRGCGEMARALVLWGYQVSILIVLNVFEVWADSKREREVGQGGDKTWNERNKIERQERGRNGDRESGVGMGGGQKEGRPMWDTHCTGLRQTHIIIATGKQFSTKYSGFIPPSALTVCKASQKHLHFPLYNSWK